MKYLRFFILLSVFIYSGCFKAFAQGVITEGKVVYEISFPDMELDQKYQAMMPSESIVYFKDKKSRTEMTVSAGIHTASILDSKSGEIITLTDMMGTKNAMILTEKDQLKSKEKTKDKVKDQFPVITYQNETKVIAGYTCKKVLIQTDAESKPIEIYYTDKLKSVMQINSGWKNFEGFPLEYTLDMEGMKMMMSAKSVTEEKVDDVQFEIPADYKILTVAEMEKMMKGYDK